MRKTMVIGILLVGIISLSLVSNVQAADMPDWTPDEGNLEGYSLKYENSFEEDNFICSNMDNLTTYIQVWYKNVTNSQTQTTELIAFICESYTDTKKEILSENIDYTTAMGLDVLYPEFDGDTVWEFFVYFLELKGTVTKIKINGWDKAVEMEKNLGSDLFDYLIVGIMGTKLIVSFSLQLNATLW